MDPELDDLPFDDAALDVKLDAHQEVFVQEYLKDLNASQAGLRSGRSNTWGMLQVKNPSILARIRVAQAQRIQRTKQTQDTVLHEMSLLASSDISHYLVDDNGQVVLAAGAPEGAMRALQSIKRRITRRYDAKTQETTTNIDVEIKLWDKPNPLKLMGRHVGLFPDKVEHSGPGGGPIETVTRVERVIVDPKEQA